MASNRTKRVEIRLKPSEWTCLWQEARDNDLTISEYIRKLISERCKK
jgi:macrodomain Ter protein organizer (MatP/YcbG family)